MEQGQEIVGVSPAEGSVNPPGSTTVKRGPDFLFAFRDSNEAALQEFKNTLASPNGVAKSKKDPKTKTLIRLADQWNNGIAGEKGWDPVLDKNNNKHDFSDFRLIASICPQVTSSSPSDSVESPSSSSTSLSSHQVLSSGKSNPSPAPRQIRSDAVAEPLFLERYNIRVICLVCQRLGKSEGNGYYNEYGLGAQLHQSDLLRKPSLASHLKTKAHQQAVEADSKTFQKTVIDPAGFKFVTLGGPSTVNSKITEKHRNYFHLINNCCYGAMMTSMSYEQTREMISTNLQSAGYVYVPSPSISLTQSLISKTIKLRLSNIMRNDYGAWQIIVDESEGFLGTAMRGLRRNMDGPQHTEAVRNYHKQQGQKQWQQYESNLQLPKRVGEDRIKNVLDAQNLRIQTIDNVTVFWCPLVPYYRGIEESITNLALSNAMRMGVQPECILGSGADGKMVKKSIVNNNSSLGVGFAATLYKRVGPTINDWCIPHIIDLIPKGSLSIGSRAKAPASSEYAAIVMKVQMPKNAVVDDRDQ